MQQPGQQTGGQGSPQTEDEPGLSTSGTSTPGTVTPGTLTPGSVTPGSLTPGVATEMLDISAGVDNLPVSSMTTGHIHKVNHLLHSFKLGGN